MVAWPSTHRRQGPSVSARAHQSKWERVLQLLGTGTEVSKQNARRTGRKKALQTRSRGLGVARAQIRRIFLLLSNFILGDDALLGGLGRNGLAEGSVELPTEALW